MRVCTQEIPYCNAGVFECAVCIEADRDRLADENARLGDVVRKARELTVALDRFDCPNCGAADGAACGEDGCSFGVLVAGVDAALAAVEGEP